MKKNNLRKMSLLLVLAFITILSVTSVQAQRNMFRKVNDFDGDGRADYAITRSDGNGVKYWWIWQTTGGSKVVQFGLSTDQEAAGDYDGDGKTDIAVWRPATTNQNSSVYYILESQTNTFRFQSLYNSNASQPMHQDYNGDGRTDTAVATGEIPKSLAIVLSGSSTSSVSSLPANHNIGIRIGDIDGNAGAEISSFETLSSGTNRIIMTNLAANSSRTALFGISNDQYQAADFDGDGKGDLTVFRPSTGVWWWIRSSDNAVNAVQFGQNGDKPVPADYDGDGKTDLAIWRNGVYWISGSQNGLSIFNWGNSSDSAVAY